MATSKNNTSDNIEQVQPEQQEQQEKQQQTEQQTEQEQTKSDKVTIQLFYDGEKYKDDVFVGVNGRRYQIKRGVEVEVPLAVKEVLDNSMRQDAAANRYMIEESSKAQKRFKEFDR